ncbi:alpha/beta hydrolase [Alteromonas gilva]|uniref:Alpha/beta hydrolase n=1 Tax=Alteromonas gilva TaxID=2987522 RepID=A0ABT5L830_9ALTE|nr:alpha/beta hydrolase [Alteromonas gilva]MDC8832614.1 alpha/beta hydrolase [Alteromonas gilva]
MLSVIKHISWLLLAALSYDAAAQTQFDLNQSFKALYSAELGTTRKCLDSAPNRYAVCSEALRGEGNAPFILFHGENSPIVVLTHGLSDSPFYVSAIASELYDSGYTVIAPLLPGHGLKNASDDMQDEQLAERWQAHLSDVIGLARDYTGQVTLGGFSTGGALSVDYYLKHPDHVNGLLLFSGALALNSNVEALSRIWGVKTLAKWLDGDYQTAGPNPQKYPNVASFAGLELMDVIRAIRERLEAGTTIKVPLFIAHSQVDQTTPIEGVIDLLSYVDADNTFYVIDAEHRLCHADLVVNRLLLEKMNFNKNRADLSETCAVPQVNPQFFPMARALRGFVEFAL